MSRKFASNGGYPERCKEFFRNKGTIKPRCDCNGCWEEYFFRNPGKVAAAALALTKFGPDTIITVQGAEHAMLVSFREFAEITAGKRKVRSNYEAIRRAYGERYLKHLKRWLNVHPMTLEEAEQIAEKNPYVQEHVVAPPEVGLTQEVAA